MLSQGTLVFAGLRREAAIDAECLSIVTVEARKVGDAALRKDTRAPLSAAKTIIVVKFVVVWLALEKML